MIWAIIKPFWTICLFRTGPQDLTHSPILMRFMMVTYGLVVYVDMVVRGVIEAIAGMVVVASITISLALFISATMALAGFKSRIVQTLTAVYGCTLLLTALLLVIELLTMVVSSIMPLPEQLFKIIFILWLFAMLSYVLHHAMSVHIMTGVFIAFSLQIAQLIVLYGAFSLMGVSIPEVPA